LGGPAPYWTDYQVDPATGNRTGTTTTATSGTVTTASYSYATAGSLHPHAVSSVTTTIGTGTPTTKSYGMADFLSCPHFRCHSNWGEIRGRDFTS